MDSGSSQHDPPRETRQRKGSAPLKAGEGAGADPIAGSAPSASETIHVGVIVPSERVVLGWLSQIYIRNNFPILQLFPQKNRGGVNYSIRTWK